MAKNVRKTNAFAGLDFTQKNETEEQLKGQMKIVDVEEEKETAPKAKAPEKEEPKKELKTRRNISVAPTLWDNATIYAKLHKTSISQLVGEYLEKITEEEKDRIEKYKKMIDNI